MMRAIKILGSIGCWACIVFAAIFYDWKAAALVALAVLLEAIIAATLIVEAENECKGCGVNEYEELLRDMEDDGK
jgi:hypothetical protein